MRVIAVSHTDPEKGEAYIFGEGVLAGEEVPVEAVGPLASMATEEGLKVPRIELDSGQVVYGCECWWGAREKVEARLSGLTFVPVDIDEHRAAYMQQVADYLGIEE